MIMGVVEGGHPVASRRGRLRGCPDRCVRHNDLTPLSFRALYHTIRARACANGHRPRTRRTGGSGASLARPPTGSGQSRSGRAGPALSAVPAESNGSAPQETGNAPYRRKLLYARLPDCHGERQPDVPALLDTTQPVCAPQTLGPADLHTASLDPLAHPATYPRKRLGCGACAPIRPDQCQVAILTLRRGCTRQSDTQVIDAPAQDRGGRIR